MENVSNLKDVFIDADNEIQVYIVGVEYQPDPSCFEDNFVGNMAMTKDNATLKPIVIRSNHFTARPMNQLRAVLAKEIIHTKTPTSFNETFLHKYKDNEYKCCDYVSIVVGNDHVNKYVSNDFGCAYLNVCHKCKWFGGNNECKTCDKENTNKHMEWICHHQNQICLRYKVSCVYQADLTQYFNAKTMKFMGMVDNLEHIC